MSLTLQQPVSGPCAWHGEDLVNDQRWIYQLDDAHRDCIDQAIRALRRRRLQFPEFTAADFPLPALQSLLQQITQDLETGYGFALLKGLPLDDYPEQDIRAMYYGIGLHLGKPVSQNPAGDLIGLVMHVGDVENPNTRVYETNAYLPYHTDPSDVVGLLCLQPAKHGGMSSLVSAAAVYNSLLSTDPEVLEALYQPTYYAHMGGDKPRLTPLFSYYQGKLSCRYLRQYIELGHEMMGVALPPAMVRALDAFDAATQQPSLRLDMMLEPGDIQFANNYAVLHSRTAFADHAEPARRRKKLRLWLKMPNARPLAPDFPGRNGFSD